MPVEPIDAQIQSLISSSKIEADRKIHKGDESDEARRSAEARLRERKKLQIKQAAERQESLGPQSARLRGRVQRVLGDPRNVELRGAVQTWQNTEQLQGKLTDAQKRLFFEAVSKDPARATKGTQAVNRLAQQPGFQRAVTNAPQMGTLHAAIIENPALETPASRILQSRFMQSPKADNRTKNDFMRFGLQQASRGDLKSVGKAGDMLGSLVGASTPRPAQRSAMNMVQRDPGNQQGMDNVDKFVRHSGVSKLAPQVLGTGVKVLSTADGDGNVRSGLEGLSDNKAFRVQSASVQKACFQAIGKDAPRAKAAAYADKVGQVFLPGRRMGQIRTGKLLGQMAQQAQENGVESIEPQVVLRAVKGAERQSAPSLLEIEGGLSHEECQRRRSKNMANVNKYFRHVDNACKGAMKKLATAKFLEDVNDLPPLKQLPLVLTKEIRQQIESAPRKGSAESESSSSLGPDADPADGPEDASRPRPPGLRQRRALGLRARGQARQKAAAGPSLHTHGMSVPADIDLSGLTPEARAILESPQVIDVSRQDPADAKKLKEKLAAAQKNLDGLSKATRQRARELRASRMPPATRKARQALERARGRQPQYFRPQVRGRMPPTQLFAAAGAEQPGDPGGPRRQQALPTSPRRAAMGRSAQAPLARQAGPAPGGGLELQHQVADVVAKMGPGPMTAEKVATVASAVAGKVAQQVAKEVTKQLLGASASEGWVPAGEDAGPLEQLFGLDDPPSPQARAPRARRAAHQQGKVDEWGLPRTFEPDLGGRPPPSVPRQAAPAGRRSAFVGAVDPFDPAHDDLSLSEGPIDDLPTEEQVDNERYSGRRLVSESVRDLSALLQVPWAKLSRDEKKLLKNLRWDQPRWDAKDGPTAEWPSTMATPFVGLTAAQRESVRLLGLTRHEWDKRVQAFTMGKNA